ncbi:MAG: hypothetical protein DI537_32940 [Stutzerimonas stutzeri]|nr:MAG: hypothetical protein DI537_32940 [Stutzerimonas stutzeri]
MLRVLLASFVMFASAAYANDEYDDVETQSRYASRLKLHQCNEEHGFPTSADPAGSDAVFFCSQRLMAFSIKDKKEKPSLQATTAQIDVSSKLQVMMNITCRPDWNSVIFGIEGNPSIDEKLAESVVVTYKIGKDRPDIGRWRFIDGAHVAVINDDAKRFVDALLKQDVTEILVKFTTPSRAITLQYNIENVAKYRALRQKYCG